MPYKKSRFNFTYRQSEDAYVVFNTYSKALVVLSSAEFEQRHCGVKPHIVFYVLCE